MQRHPHRAFLHREPGRGILDGHAFHRNRLQHVALARRQTAQVHRHLLRRDLILGRRRSDALGEIVDIDEYAAAPAAQWNVGWLPLGFTLTDLPQATSGRRTYTDGLAVFSVFLEPLGQDIRPGEGVVSSGGTTSYTRGMHLGGQPVLVTVIGEVPLNTARMVADSIGAGH